MFKKINIEYILLALILLGGFFVRLYKINNPVADWHSWRQADTSAVTRNYLSNGINLLLPKYDDISSIQSKISNPEGFRMVEFPIYNAIGAVLAKNFQGLSLEVWQRLITIFCALTTGFFLYLIGKKLLPGWGGIFAIFYYLFIPFNIYFTRVILPDPLGVTFAVISIWVFLKYSENKKNIYFFSSAVFLALALLIKPYLGFYVFPIAFLSYKKVNFKQIAVFLAISFIPFMLWRVWESRFPEGIPLFLWAFDGDMIRFRPSFWYWIFGERLGHLILGSFGLIPFIYGFNESKKKSRFILALLLGCLFYVVVVATANVKHDYYQILTIPAIALTLAAGSVYLFSKQKILLAFSVAIMLITGWYQIAGNYAVNHWEIIEAGQEIDKITPKDALVVAPYNGDTAFLYQTKRKGWPVLDDSIDHIITKGASYYVSVDLGSADTKMIESRFRTIEKNDKFIIIDLHQATK